MICQLISNELFREEFGHEFGDSVIEYRLIGIVALQVTIVRTPTHPFWLGWQIPFVRIEVGLKRDLILA